MSIKFEANNLYEKLNKLTNQIDEVADEALREVAENIVQDAKTLAPVRTGYLRDSIDYQKTDDGYEIFVEAEYAPFVEYGTSKMTAQPFFRPAVEKNLVDAQKIITEEIKKVVDK